MRAFYAMAFYLICLAVSVYHVSTNPALATWWLVLGFSFREEWLRDRT